MIKYDADRNGRETEIYAGSPLVVLGRTRAQRDGWGYRVALRTPAGEWPTLTIPAHLLAGDGRELREVLARAGAILPQSRNGRQALAMPLAARSSRSRPGPAGMATVSCCRIALSGRSVRMRSSSIWAISSIFWRRPAAWRAGRNWRGMQSIIAGPHS